MDREKPQQARKQAAKNQAGRLKNVSQVITNMLMEPAPMPDDFHPRTKDPVPPELVADAVGWAPSMPPGPLLVDLSAHDPHKTKVPLSEAITQPPFSPSPHLKPPSNLDVAPPPPKKRRFKSQFVVIGGAFIGAVGTVFFIAVVLLLFGYAT